MENLKPYHEILVKRVKFLNSALFKIQSTFNKTDPITNWIKYINIQMDFA